MYRTGKAAQRLLPLTPLVQTGNQCMMQHLYKQMLDSCIQIFTFLIAEKFSSWLTHKVPGPELLRHVTGARQFSAAPPPPPESALQQESFLSGSSGSYVEEMYEAWSYDPKSVHASWDAYFR